MFPANNTNPVTAGVLPTYEESQRVTANQQREQEDIRARTILSSLSDCTPVSRKRILERAIVIINQQPE